MDTRNTDGGCIPCNKGSLGEGVTDPRTAICRGLYTDGTVVEYDLICPVCGFAITDLGCAEGVCANCGCMYHIPSHKPVGFEGDGYHRVSSWYKVCVDLDGVVFNFNEGVRIVSRLNGVKFDPDKVTDYHYRCDCGISYADIEDLLHDVNFYRLLPYREGACVALSRLNSCPDIISEGYSSVCVESECDPVYKYREAVFKDLGLSGRPVLGEAKLVHYDAVAVIDDNLDIIDKWINSGTPALIYLVDAPYNQFRFKDMYYYRDVIRVSSLGDAVDDILAKREEGVLDDICRCQSSFAYKG